MDTFSIIEVLRLVAVLIAAIVLGNWFMAENKKNKIKGGPWYGAYTSIPGIIIFVSILVLPIVWVLLKR